MQDNLSLQTEITTALQNEVYRATKFKTNKHEISSWKQSYHNPTEPSLIPSPTSMSGGPSLWPYFSFNQSLRFCKLYAPGPGVWDSLESNLEDWTLTETKSSRKDYFQKLKYSTLYYSVKERKKG